MKLPARRAWWGEITGMTLAVLTGIICSFPIGDGLALKSYDLLYHFRAARPPQEAVIVYIDDDSLKDLKKPGERALDRSYYARLIERLRRDGAAAVMMDILFTDPGPNPDADQLLREAIAANGKVVLAGQRVPADDPRLGGSKLERPLQALEQAAWGWGLVNVHKEGDRTVRRQFFGNEEEPSISWKTAQLLDAPAIRGFYPRSATRWLQYYGPPGTIPFVTLANAVADDGISSSVFKGKLVVVGAKPTAGFTGDTLEEFFNPFPTTQSRFSPGVEVQATALLNLVRGEWFNRFSPIVEVALLIIAGLGSGFGLTRLRPFRAVLGTGAIAIITATFAWYLAWRHHYWFAWLIVVVQAVTALGWSVLFNSITAYVDTQVLQRSLSLHLSPARVRELLKRPELLRPGTERTEVTILFSDIAAYSKFSESLDADDLVRQLNEYYEVALSCIHETEGTVVQLVGDAIFAIWNAPVRQENHRERGCRSALLLAQKLDPARMTRRGMPFRTRIGLHTGTASVGNIGSSNFFVYAAIGENTNLASRLEGLNKHLDTQVLATRDVQKAVEGKLVTRLVGHFRFKGFGYAVEVHELLGERDMAEAAREWLEAFDIALDRYRKRDFAAAETGFKRAVELRRTSNANREGSEPTDRGDGPSAFYLRLIERYRQSPPPADWIGEVGMDEK